MRISTRISLSSSALAFVVFGGVGTLQVLMQKQDLERELMRNASTLCQATAQSLRQDIAEEDPEDSTALLRSFPGYDRNLDVTVWRPGAAHTLPSTVFPERAAHVEEVAMEAITTDAVASRIADVASGRRVAILASPIDTGEHASAVVLVHPLDDIDADVLAAAVVTAVAVALFSVLGGLVGLFLGTVYIVRPLARLDEAMSSVAAGDLAAPLLGGGRDEVGRALSHFDEMRSELRKARTRLESEQVAHRSTLERLADADRLVTVGQLAAGLAHEIGSPLQILGGRARKLVARAEPESDVAKSASIIVAQTDRITRIVRQLLQFARPRASQRRRVNPAACITPVVDLLELEAGRRGVTIRLAAGADAHQQALVDADALQQIVFNLARNGLAAVSKGGAIDIRVDVEPPVEGAPPWLELVVADDGAGISEETREQVFEPFFTTRAREGGIGLGLAVVRTLVEHMNGSISFTSRRPGGTEFIVRVPC